MTVRERVAKVEKSRMGKVRAALVLRSSMRLPMLATLPLVMQRIKAVH